MEKIMLDLNAVYEVITFAIGDTKAGSKMGKLQVKNLLDSSVLNCILWEETLNRLDSKLFRSNNHIKIINGTYNEKYNNCLVSEIELVKEAKLGLDKGQREEIFSKITAYIDKIKDKKLAQFVSSYLFKYEDKFKIIPAAKLMHHNYIGGLLQHTYECLDIADTILPKYNNKLNYDDVYAACIMHDFGKIFEYTVDMETGLIEYNEEFRKDWRTHSQWGFSICMNNGFKDIAKMIAAHHGRTDWGALIDLSEKDIEPFMYIVHHIDDLSAKYGKISVTDLN
ncbi:MAG: HD domain-containing protein [Candidatus Gastranaerophilales bacterium]|nr:HD domain-containing protein [Candidatus Gastranaerophilales bacterium]